MTVDFRSPIPTQSRVHFRLLLCTITTHESRSFRNANADSVVWKDFICVSMKYVDDLQNDVPVDGSLGSGLLKSQLPAHGK